MIEKLGAFFFVSIGREVVILVVCMDRGYLFVVEGVVFRNDVGVVFVC